MNRFNNLDPMDFRYMRSPKLKKLLLPYLSENALIAHMAQVEAALVKVLAKRKVCSKDVAKQVFTACNKVTAEEVYEEEDRIKHNIRALANMIRKRVNNKAKPYVHLTATSHDIICTAEALRYKELTNNVLVPTLIELEKTLISISLREKNTLQIGRTHGQHAEPITFGFTMAEYVSRLGTRIQAIKTSGNNLRGQFSGAVGAYNASSLFFSSPMDFEKEVLKELSLKPAMHSTQVVEPEYMADFMHSIISCFGVLANLADDMRNLQRSEIGEVGELFAKKQVGSSTMPHKRNPINFENVKSMWKAMVPRMMTSYMDQISEHQRDLTNSASSRFIPTLLSAFIASTMRMTRTMKKLGVDKANLKKNFDMNKNMLAAEPLYILLAFHDHPNAHEVVRQLTLESQKTGAPLQDLAFDNAKLKPYLKKFTKQQLAVIKDPEKYTGASAKKVEKVCNYWKYYKG